MEEDKDSKPYNGNLVNSNSFVILSGLADVIRTIKFVPYLTAFFEHNMFTFQAPVLYAKERQETLDIFKLFFEEYYDAVESKGKELYPACSSNKTILDKTKIDLLNIIEKILKGDSFYAPYLSDPFQTINNRAKGVGVKFMSVLEKNIITYSLVVLSMNINTEGDVTIVKELKRVVHK